MATSPSRDRVTARLSQLQDSYDGFDVRQTTVSVGSDEYERAVAGTEGVARADVRVRDGDRVLCVPDGDGWVDPGRPVGAGQSIAATARAAVERQTGVRPTIEGVERVAIASVNDDEVPENGPVYRLRVRFAGRPDRGAVRPGVAEWRREPPTDDPVL